MDEREYNIFLPDGASIRIWLRKHRGHVLRFTAQLEAYLGNDWAPISRYDNAHGFVHRDDLKPDGTQIKSPALSFDTNRDALKFAIADLRSNSQTYIERYLQWKN
jgi:hypothetical protein